MANKLASIGVKRLALSVAVLVVTTSVLVGIACAGCILIQVSGMWRHMRNVQRGMQVTPVQAERIREEAEILVSIYRTTGRTRFEFADIPQECNHLRQINPLRVEIWHRSNDPYYRVRVVLGGGLMQAGISVGVSDDDISIPPPALWKTRQVASNVWTYHQ